LKDALTQTPGRKDKAIRSDIYQMMCKAPRETELDSSALPDPTFNAADILVTLHEAVFRSAKLLHRPVENNSGQTTNILLSPSESYPIFENEARSENFPN
jgi:hypothetical protein